MENATKALLIAGSVLIAILLIAFGLRIFNSTKGTSEAAQTTMDSTEMAMFYNKFNQYMGTISGIKVRSLYDVIIANNSTSDTGHKVLLSSTIGGPRTVTASEPSDISEEAKKINNSSEYYVTINKTPVSTRNGTFIATISVELN